MTTLANPWDEPDTINRPPAHQIFSRVMVTGHRPQHLTAAELAWSQVILNHTAWRLRSVYGMRHGISGLALGADTWWAMAVLACGAKLDVHIPFEDQAIKWSEADRELWAELRRRAHSEVVVGGKEYNVRMLHARNDSMINAVGNDGLVVALFKPGTTGGTASAIEKARKKGRAMLLLDPTTRTMSKENWSD